MKREKALRWGNSKAMSILHKNDRDWWDVLKGFSNTNLQRSLLMTVKSAERWFIASSTKNELLLKQWPGCLETLAEVLQPENMKKMVTPSNESFEVSRKSQPQDRNCAKVTGGTMTSVKLTSVLKSLCWTHFEIRQGREKRCHDHMLWKVWQCI